MKNLSGTYEGINWSSFTRTRAGRRDVVCVKYSRVPGEWTELTAPREVTNEAKLRAWLRSELDQILELGEKPKAKALRNAPTVRELFDKWIELREADVNVSGATLAGDRTNFKSQILKTWGDVPVLALEGKRAELRAWIRDLKARVSPIRTSNVVSSFRTFLSACANDLSVPLRSNPLANDAVRDLMPAQPKRRVVSMPVELVQALLDCDSPEVEFRDAVRYAVAVNTGAADGELAGARVSSVLGLTGSSPILEVLSAFKLKAKKRDGAKRRSAELGPPKNQNRVRPIPLNECARVALSAWLDYGWEHFVGRPPELTDPLFPERFGKFSRPASAKKLRADLVAAKLPARNDRGAPYQFKTLRATFSTLLAARKVPREWREQLMGQGTDSVNSRHYTGEVPAELFDAVRRLPFVWRRSLPSVQTSRSGMEPAVGFEPTTCRLRSGCSTTELSGPGGALGADLGGAMSNPAVLPAFGNSERCITNSPYSPASLECSGNHSTILPGRAVSDEEKAASCDNAPKELGAPDARFRPAQAWALAFAAERVLARRPASGGARSVAEIRSHKRSRKGVA